jgi:bis(5'-nucleosyl)-tetraphosphatase (symmetrical)
MTSFAVGDLQGCLSSFAKLASNLPPQARFIFVGDLVNRGPESLATLRHVKRLADTGRAVALLGNHDLHLLAVAAGIRPLHDTDTFDEILNAPDRDELLSWLRARPLAWLEEETLFVHAGVLPAWTAEQTLVLAEEVRSRLAAPDHHEFLAAMYGNDPKRWSDDLVGNDRLRCVVNALTRLRIVTSDGKMKLKFKEHASRAPQGTMPWFDHPDRKTRDTLVVFGHWSTQGLLVRPDVIGLDSGCVWGGKLSALRLSDRAIFQVDCEACASTAD